MARIVNIPDISPAGDRFIEIDGVEWIWLSGLPAGPIERAVPRPRLSRYRGALQAALAAKADAAVISHLPRMTAAVSDALALLGRNAPHLGFSFNFTTLPYGQQRARLARAFARVDQFAIFSRFERALYADHFDIPPERFAPVMWTQDAPTVGALPEGAPTRPFVCAIGGEGRDFATLIEALRHLPAGIDAAIVARPHSLAGLSLPDHVRLFTNLPIAETWALAAASRGVLVPLKDAETCCGHVTLVSAKLLGVPLITSFSEATRDYVEDRETVLVTPPGDAAALRGAIERLADEGPQLRLRAEAAVAQERAIHDRAIWTRYVQDFLDRH